MYTNLIILILILSSQIGFMFSLFMLLQRNYDGIDYALIMCVTSTITFVLSLTLSIALYLFYY